MSRLRASVRRALWDVVPPDGRETPRELRRRRLVTVGFLVLGTLVLALSLRLEPGSRWLYPATFGLAVIWTVGALASGPLRLGRAGAGPALLGLALAGVFVAGALVVRSVSWLDGLEGQVVAVADVADRGSLPLLLLVTAGNGVAEELFFRGAAYAASPRRPVLWTTAGYALVTLATGNAMLAFAALLLGALCGLERRACGGVLAPILTHCTWSLTMLVALPLIFR
jgi:membrane protease YdiL (CAAX protease family)